MSKGGIAATVFRSMPIRLAAVVSIIAQLVATAAPASASGPGTITSCSFSTLQAAVQAGGTITYGTDCSDIQFTATLLVPAKASVDIEANSHTVVFDGKNSSTQVRLFQVEGGTLKIASITLENGLAEGTAGADGANGADGQMGASDLNTHNVGEDGQNGGDGTDGKPGETGKTGSDASGGAILIDSGSVTLVADTLANNRAVGGNGGNGGSGGAPGNGGDGGAGGAPVAYGGLKYDPNYNSRCAITGAPYGNGADGPAGGNGGSGGNGGQPGAGGTGGDAGSASGGAIYNHGTLKVTNAIFSGNSATGGEGGAGGHGGTVEETDINYSDGSGGAAGDGGGGCPGAPWGSKGGDAGHAGLPGPAGLPSDNGPGGAAGNGGSGSGGAIFNVGTATLNHVTFSNDTAAGGRGGAGGDGGNAGAAPDAYVVTTMEGGGNPACTVKPDPSGLPGCGGGGSPGAGPNGQDGGDGGDAAPAVPGLDVPADIPGGKGGDGANGGDGGDAQGGAIDNSGILTITTLSLLNDTALGGDGGAGGHGGTGEAGLIGGDGGGGGTGGDGGVGGCCTDAHNGGHAGTSTDGAAAGASGPGGDGGDGGDGGNGGNAEGGAIYSAVPFAFSAATANTDIAQGGAAGPGGKGGQGGAGGYGDLGGAGGNMGAWGLSYLGYQEQDKASYPGNGGAGGNAGDGGSGGSGGSTGAGGSGFGGAVFSDGGITGSGDTFAQDVASAGSSGVGTCGSPAPCPGAGGAAGPGGQVGLGGQGGLGNPDRSQIDGVQGYPNGANGANGQDGADGQAGDAGNTGQPNSYGYPDIFPSVTPPDGGPITDAELLGCANPATPNDPGCVSAGPVSVQSVDGELVLSLKELAIPGRGIPLFFGLTYNSLAAATQSGVGFGWTDPYLMRVKENQDTSVTVTQEDGSQIEFLPQSGDTYTPVAPRFQATLTANQGGGWTMVRNAVQTFTFDDIGRLTSMSDLNGYTTTVSYAATGITVTEPAGRKLHLTLRNGRVIGVTDPANRHVTLAYDGADNLSAVTDVGGGVTKLGYDSRHRLISITDPLKHLSTIAYNTAGQAATVTDPMGRKTSFSYKGTPLTADGGTTTVTDPRGLVSSVSYQNGEIVSTTSAQKTKLAVSSAVAQDPATLAPTTLVGSMGQITTAVYDARGNPTSVTDPHGQTATTTYNDFNEPLTSTDPMGVTTTYTYDSHGNPLTVSSEGQTTTFTYGDVSHPGDVTKITDPLGHVTNLSYDTFGDITSMTDADGHKSSTTYNNPLGEGTQFTSPRGFTTTATYDAFGRPLTITDPLGDKSAAAYDADGNPTSVTNANGASSLAAYDADNELTTVLRPDHTSLSYQYDADGNITAQIDGAGDKTTFSYDGLNRTSAITDPLGNTTSATYDAGGRLLTLTDPLKQVTSYAYNVDNQLTSVSYSNPDTPPVSSLTYDADGRLLSMTDGTGTSTWQYDSLGRLTSTTDGSGATVGYSWDQANRLTGLTYPNEKTVTYRYDDADQQTSLTDFAGRTTNFSYDADGDLTNQAYPNGVVVTYTYNHADQLTGIGDAGPGGALAQTVYALDKLGQIVGSTPSGLPGDSHHTYTYTSLGQLLKIDGKTAYTYDKAENPLTEPGSSLTYSASGAPITETPKGKSATGLGYDANGNRTARGSGQSKTTYMWDQADKLIGISGPSGSETRAYNGSGALTDVTTGAGADHYVYGPAGVLTDSSNTFIWGPSGPVEQLDASGTPTYLSQDRLGSTRLLTNGSGAIAGASTWTPQGKLQKHTGTASSPLGYAGALTDPSGMLDLGARTYDPSTAAFLSRDPAVAKTQQPYSYTGDTFLNATDPSGMLTLYGEISDDPGAGSGDSTSPPDEPEASTPVPDPAAPPVDESPEDYSTPAVETTKDTVDDILQTTLDGLIRGALKPGLSAGLQTQLRGGASGVLSNLKGWAGREGGPAMFLVNLELNYLKDGAINVMRQAGVDSGVAGTIGTAWSSFTSGAIATSGAALKYGFERYEEVFGEEATGEQALAESASLGSLPILVGAITTMDIALVRQILDTTDTIEQTFEQDDKNQDFYEGMVKNYLEVRRRHGLP